MAVLLRAAHRVVKFMVKVRLMENRVKSHVGRVIVVKVMIQYNAPGRTVRIRRITRASRPRVEDSVVVSKFLTVAAAVCKASASVEGKLAGGELAELIASAAADM